MRKKEKKVTERLLVVHSFALYGSLISACFYQLALVTGCVGAGVKTTMTCTSPVGNFKASVLSRDHFITGLKFLVVDNLCMTISNIYLSLGSFTLHG